jgi:hypothetical protein
MGCGYHEISHVGFLGVRLFELRAVRDSLQERGLAGTSRKIAEKLGLVAPARTEAGAASRRISNAEEVLGLVPGEWVEVKSAEEIRGTLDRKGMFRGLFFMDEMWKYCGKRFRVLKRMERLMVERTGTMRSIKNTVLLDGTLCDGAAHENCDAMCQHLWREVWLRRVEGPEASAAGESGADEAGADEAAVRP